MPPAFGGYLKLVNGTPYAWRKQETYQYQMNEATWYDYIGPFSTNTVYFEFQDPAFGNLADDEAWAYYQMEGTPYKFCLWANNKGGEPKIILQLTDMNSVSNHKNDKIKIGWRTNPARGDIFNGVTCIIAGHDGGFFTTSQNPLHHKAWMARSLHVIGDRTLREICLPASHNSGMFKITAKASPAYEDYVLCQSRSIADQLALGVRFFDIRPVLDKKGEWFYTGHYSYSARLGWIGGSGDWMGYIVEQINEFTRDHAEVIVLNISHAYNIQHGWRDFNQGDWERLFKADLDRLNYLYRASHAEQDLTRLTVKELTANGTKAAVILRFNCNKFDKDAVDLTVGGRHGNGYFYYNNFPLFDQYAEADTPNALVKDQMKKLGERRDRGNNPGEGEVFMMNWALTPTGNASSAVHIYPSLHTWASDYMTPRLGELYDKLWGRVFPNLIAMDYIETTDALAMCVAINEWQKSKR
ncbi:PLC-like phosphodiesterase, TIM beta/alpha-barrel-containing domain containing protein [Naviculisporaceae sp. PSN 640]